MILQDVTMRNYGRYQPLLEKYDDEEFAPLVRACALVRAAREAGIADALPPPLDEGDPLDLPPTAENRNLLIETALAIQTHLNEATADRTGE